MVILKEIRMRELVCVIRLSVALAALQGFGGCAMPGPSEQPPWAPVPIQEFKSVAGKWEGLMERAPQTRHDDWVKVVIHEDGRYEFASYRTIGVLNGKGVLALSDGMVTATSERGSATLTLYVAGDRRLFRVVGMTHDGIKFEAELAPAK
jgi:hypothetical protein